MHKKLGELLVEAGVITSGQLQLALAQQRSRGGQIGTNLIRLGYLKEPNLGRFLAKQFKIPFIDLSTYAITPQILGMIPRTMAERYLVLPLGIKGKRLTLAMADPADLAASEEIQFVTGYQIDPVVAMESSIRTEIDRLYKKRRAGSRSVQSRKKSDQIPPVEAEDSDKEMIPGLSAAPPETLKALVTLLVQKGIISREELIREIKEIS